MTTSTSTSNPVFTMSFTPEDAIVAAEESSADADGFAVDFTSEDVAIILEVLSYQAYYAGRDYADSDRFTSLANHLCKLEGDREEQRLMQQQGIPIKERPFSGTITLSQATLLIHSLQEHQKNGWAISETESGGIRREAVGRLEVQEFLNRALPYLMLVVAVNDVAE